MGMCLMLNLLPALQWMSCGEVRGVIFAARYRFSYSSGESLRVWVISELSAPMLDPILRLEEMVFGEESPCAGRCKPACC